MKDTYCLKIDCSPNDIKKVEEILRRKSSNLDNLFWEWSIEQDLLPSNAFDTFLNLLEGKYDDLAKIGLQRNDISIWRYYEYDQECNLEISPEEMKRLGDQGIVLCISCWQYSQ